ncbi:MAG: insulinase family protein [Phycisphaerales bacterium]|nr:insulinase family protein [Phycisphaerales bacterium]
MTGITQHTTSQGLAVVIESNPSVRSAGVVWMLPAGAATDPADRLGMSAVWSELLMRGAGSLDSRAQADAFDRVGADRSARVSSRFLTLGLSVVGGRLLEALPLLVDMVRRPRFDEASIGPSKELCLQSIEALKDDPGERAVLGARARHLAAPFNRSTLGTTEGIGALTRDELVESWRARAAPRGSILAVAGDVDPGAVIGALEPLLAGWEGGPAEARASGTPPRGYAHEADKTNQVQIILAADAPAEPDERSLLEKLAASVLSGGMSSRLFTEVREKRGLCYSVHARYSGDRDFGMLAADVGTQPDRAQQSLDVLTTELERITTPEGRVTPDEFRRAVVGMKSRLVFSGESTGARASALAGDMHRLGRPRSLDEVAARIDAITLDGLNGYLSTRRLGRVTVQTVGPESLTMPPSLR